MQVVAFRDIPISLHLRQSVVREIISIPAHCSQVSLISRKNSTYVHMSMLKILAVIAIANTGHIIILCPENF